MNKHSARMFVIIIATAIATSLLASPSYAQSRAAVNFCNATNLTPDGASVPSGMRDRNFVTDLYGTYDLKCGNGSTWGAVHIERKHNVDNWDQAIDCMRNVFAYGSSSYDSSTGKRTYVFYWGSTWAKVVTGDNGIITAFPSDSGSAASWDDCGQQ